MVRVLPDPTYSTLGVSTLDEHMGEHSCQSGFKSNRSRVAPHLGASNTFTSPLGEVYVLGTASYSNQAVAS